MKTKQAMGMVLVLALLVLLALAARSDLSPAAVAEAPRPAPPLAPRAAAPNVERVSTVPVAMASLAEIASGAILTQTFTLSAGWNAVYLGVEPVNPSPLVNEARPGEPPRWVNELSTMQAIFGTLGADLDSVWTYRQPISSKDYIVDPGEGLWDEPGWDRYIPPTNVDEAGKSRAFLTTLHTLHANTGYLVKMNAPASITVWGRPVPGHHRWQAGAYNLSGFPISPGAAPTLQTFIVGSPVPILEVRELTGDGLWSGPLTGAQTLTSGMAYLVRYSADPNAVANYTAPLDVRSSSVGGPLPSQGLAFKAGASGSKQSLFVKNLAGAETQVMLRLKGLPTGSPVALHYYSDTSDENLLTRQNNELMITLPVDGQILKFMVPVAEQPIAGEALLEISSDALGARWLIPVAAEAGAYTGLWVGEAFVNDVSEARLGATDAVTDVTIALSPAAGSGVRGAAELRERPDQTVIITVTLSFPAETPASATPPEVATPYVHGYVFLDANQNGQRDRTEIGLKDVPVSIGSQSTTTLADGSYWLGSLAQGQHNLQASPQSGYTEAFLVTPPSEVADVVTPTLPVNNSLPAAVTLDAVGATGVEPAEYLAQILPEPIPPATTYLPYYDGNDRRVEPPLNFGYVRADTARLRAGTCDSPREDLDLLPSPGTVKNGRLVATHDGRLADLLGDTNIYIERNGVAVACGNIVVGAPTAFEDGRGSVARFRVLLRVKEVTLQGGGKVLLPEILPYYVITDTQRISAVNFLSLQHPVISAGVFGVTDTPLRFNLTIPANDPLNPFKHKYSPDHDNLDRKFQNYQESVQQYQYESPQVDRRVTLVLKSEPWEGDPAALDWGGATWGGDYQEVVDGLHKNTITARGYFLIRRVLPAERLVPQDYDQVGGGQ